MNQSPLSHLNQRHLALGLAGVGGAILLWYALNPLPWHVLPNFARFLNSSWLTLVITGGIIWCGLSTVAQRKSTARMMLGCLIAGLAWKYARPWIPMPFPMGRYLILYGLSGLVAHFIRKAVTAPAAPLSAPAAVPVESPRL